MFKNQISTETRHSLVSKFARVFMLFEGHLIQCHLVFLLLGTSTKIYIFEISEKIQGYIFYVDVGLAGGKGSQVL